MKVFVKSPSFSDRLGKVKGMFRKAFDDANALHSEMQEDICKKTEEITALSLEVNNLKELQRETKEFMSNLEKFI